jgi:hypothetical protein
MCSICCSFVLCACVQEVRVPFNAIVMGIEQMQMDLAQHYQTLPGTLDTLDILSEQSAVVSRILNDSLSMQKIEDGALVLEYDNFSLERMIRGALYAFRTPCLEKKLRVRVSLQSLDALVSQTLPGLRLGKATLVSTSNSRGRGGGIGGGGGGMLAAGALHNHNIAVDGNGAGAIGSPLQDGAAVGGDDNGGIDGNAQVGAATGGISMMGGESGVGVSIGGGGTSTAPGDGLSSAAGGLFAGGGGRQSHMQSHTIGSDTNASQGQNTIVYHANVRGDPYRLRQVLANFVSVRCFPWPSVLLPRLLCVSWLLIPNLCPLRFVCLLVGLFDCSERREIHSEWRPVARFARCVPLRGEPTRGGGFRSFDGAAERSSRRRAEALALHARVVVTGTAGRHARPWPKPLQ